MRNPYHALAPIVDDDAVGLRGGPIINQAIRTVMAVRMLVARRGDVSRHGIAAVVGHAATIARRIDVRNGWILLKKSNDEPGRAILPKSGKFEPSNISDLASAVCGEIGEKGPLQRVSGLFQQYRWKADIGSTKPRDRF